MKLRKNKQITLLSGNVKPSLIMFIPSAILFVIVSVYPFTWLFKYIFYDYNGYTSYYVGFENFARLFRDTIYWKSVLQTFYYAALKLLLVLPVSMGAALLLNRKIRGKNIFRTIFFLPTVISAAVFSLIWFFIYSPYNGILNEFINSIGIYAGKVDWLGNPSIAMISISVVSLWGGFGNYLILFLAGLQSVPKEIYESSQIDGSNKVQDFFNITLPMMGPILKVILMLAITTALKDYESIMVMTGGGPFNKTNVMFLHVYKLLFGSQTSGATLQIGYGATVGLMSAVIIGIITVIYLNVSKKLDDIY